MPRESLSRGAYTNNILSDMSRVLSINRNTGLNFIVSVNGNATRAVWSWNAGLDWTQAFVLYASYRRLAALPLTPPLQRRIPRFVLERGWFIDYICIHMCGITCAFPCFFAQKFVEKFSRELNTEYGGKGKNSANIVVQCVMPGYVATNMSKITKTSWMVPSPDKFVRSALQTTGLEPVTTGYLPHTLMVSALSPRSPSDDAFILLFSSVFRFSFSLHVETVMLTFQRQLVIHGGGDRREKGAKYHYVSSNPQISSLFSAVVIVFAQPRPHH